MGGNATNGKPIPGELSNEMYIRISEELQILFNITADDIKPLGSVGKKPKGEFCGDIDIAINQTAIKLPNVFIKEHIGDYVSYILDDVYENVDHQKGIAVISFSYPILNSNELGQVDIMLSDNLELSTFMFHSPDFTKNESKYKGLYRNQLLFAITRHMETNDESDYYENGDVKSYSKYSLTANKGLFKQLKTFEGKNGRVKNPKTLKGFDSIIASNPIGIIEYIFGNGYYIEDVNSFESIYDIITSSSFKHIDKRDEILKDFTNSIIRLKLEVPTELKTSWRE